MNHADLYARYLKASDHWGALTRQAERRGEPSPSGAEVSQLPDLRQQLEAAQAELQAVIAEIRKVPDYEYFLRSLPAQQIQALAYDAPLAYLAATPAGGMALIVTGEKITPVWLDSLTDGALREAVLGPADDPGLGGYLGAYDAWRTSVLDKKIPTEILLIASCAWLITLENTTRWLWQACMEPLVEAFTSPHPALPSPDLGRGEGVRAVLIPSGLLGLLPLHAAWMADPSTPTGRRYALDLVNFTYAPNAHALLATREAVDRPADSLLGVENPDGSIWFSDEAISAAVTHFDPIKVIRLPGDQATSERVKDGMQRSAVLQFYTHGIAGFSQPLDSRLLLANREHLTLGEILELHLMQSRLAILAACETAVIGTPALDEVISLPTGFMQAGVPGVIGSLWIVRDDSTMMLMTRFYDYWKREQIPPVEALRRAQTWLRDTTNGEKQTYFKKSLPEYSGALMPEVTAREALRKMFLLETNARSFSHPYYWAAFGYTGW